VGGVPVDQPAFTSSNLFLNALERPPFPPRALSATPERKPIGTLPDYSRELEQSPLPDPEVAHNLSLALQALSSPFGSLSVSFGGVFASMIPQSDLNLDRVAAAFGVPGSQHTFQNVSFELLSSANPGNFAILKFTLLDLPKVTLKVYQRRDLQIYGLRDTILDEKQVTAHELAHIVSGFALSRLNEMLGSQFTHLHKLEMMAVFGSHPGVKDARLSFDLPVLQQLLSSAQKPGQTVTRNERNHSVILSMGKKLGSQIFHGTGTIQLMGTRVPADQVLIQLRQLVTSHPEVLLPTEEKRKRRYTTTSRPALPKARASAPSSPPTKRRRTPSSIDELLSDATLMAQLDSLISYPQDDDRQPSDVESLSYPVSPDTGSSDLRVDGDDDTLATLSDSGDVEGDLGLFDSLFFPLAAPEEEERNHEDLLWM